MLNFNFQAPTRILFGQGETNKLGKEIRKHGSRVLLVYGGGSIKKSGLYDQVVQILADHAITCIELSGVQPNPRIDSVRQGVTLCRKHQLDFVLAVGGGSSLDCAKAIAAGVKYEGDPWDFFIGKAFIKEALPIGSILTLAATGSEMNPFTVISNPETGEKLGTGSTRLNPRFSILDPVHTFSVSAEQTAAGTADIMSHVFEQYFSPTPGTYIQDRMAEAMLKTCIKYGPLAIAEPDNYEARSNLMWTSSLALNGLLSTGKITDWATHDIEHKLSALYDITHGLGLAILTPYWMKQVLNEQTAAKMATYARNVWDITETNDMQAALEGIAQTANFFRSLGIPATFKDIGLNTDQLTEIAADVTSKGSLGSFKKLTYEDVLNILQSAYWGTGF